MLHIAVFINGQTHLLAACDGKSELTHSARELPHAHDWLSGTNALDDWYDNEIPAIHSTVRDCSANEPQTEAFLVSQTLKPAVQAALGGSDSAALSARLVELEAALKRGEIRTLRELRSRLDAFGPWALPPTNQVNLAPPVACPWGTEPLRVGLLRRTVGYLDFTFPPASATSSGSAASSSTHSPRRIVVTCPHAMDAGGSFSNLRALAWTDDLPVFGIRPALNTSLGKEGANDLWQSQTSEAEWLTLLCAARHRIEQLCAEQGIEISAVTLVGFSLGASNAVRLAEAWPEVVDSGISLGSSAFIQPPAPPAMPLPWLTIRAHGDGTDTGPSLADFFAERATEATSPALELHTAPDFRFKENYAFAWRHLDTRLQSALARAFIRDLPRDQPIASQDQAKLAALHAHLATFTPRIEPVHSPDLGELLAAAIAPAGAPRGLVISLPSSATSPDDTWPIELGWWGEKHWAALIAPDASPETLRALLAWVDRHPTWGGMPRYLVLHEANPQSAKLWPQALALAHDARLRALGWIASTDSLYQNPAAAQEWSGPGVIGAETSPFHLFVSDGAQLPPGVLARQAGGPPVLAMAASDTVLRPPVEAAWLALARIFRADALGFSQTQTSAAPSIGHLSTPPAPSFP